MWKKIRYIMIIIVITSLILTGCSSAGNKTDTNITTEEEQTTQSEGSSIIATQTSSEVVVDTEFSAKDLEIGYDESVATNITLKDNAIEVTGTGAVAEQSTLTIQKEGTYILSGTLTDGQIIVDTADTEKVRLVLKGVDIHSSDSSAIYIKNADKVFITLDKDTTNILSDTANYVQSDENTVDGVIFSTADLTFNGEGTLKVTGSYKHGIVSKDDLVFTGGTYDIQAVKDALNGKDSVKIKDGTFTLNAETGNGIQSKHDEDVTKGYVYISGGTIKVASSVEGIEGTAIVIEGGNIDITASDDGLNSSSGITETTTSTSTDSVSTDADQNSAVLLSTTENEQPAMPQTDGTAPTFPEDGTLPEISGDGTFPEAPSDGSFPNFPNNGTDDTTTDGNTPGNRGNGFGGNGMQGGMGGGEFENNANCYIMISGGTINVNAAGDGIDSNGSIYISGGTITVSGPTNDGNAGFDYNGTANITGGTVVIAGSSGMAQGFSDTSTQYSFLHNFSSTIAAGTEIVVTDDAGKEIISYVAEKEFNSVVVSSPDLTNGKTYTLTSGDQTAEVTLSSVATSSGEQSGGFGGGGMRGNKGGMQRP
ncbi:MAG: carbohydrate-binding domain-containing protein [Mobilitalea sp.]